MDAFAAWAAGDTAKADEVRDAEHDCDEVRRRLVDAVSEAFTTPLEPEDLFQLSRDLDKVINGAKNTVREAEAMEVPPDQATAEMAVLLAEGVGHLRTAFAFLDGSGKSAVSATEAADAAGEVPAQPRANLPAGGRGPASVHRRPGRHRPPRVLPADLGHLR